MGLPFVVTVADALPAAAQTGTVPTLSAGVRDTCAVLAYGTVKCWGYNPYGQLGDGTTTDRYLPTPVSGLAGATSVATGIDSTCALLSAGTVKCWGRNSVGQIGDGTMTDRLAPTTVSGLSGVAALTSGRQFACALLTGGTVKCWGDNGAGQIGQGTMTLSVPTPATVGGLSGVTAIAAEGSTACALLSGGTVKCWGDGATGQLGDGISLPRATPVTVSGVTTAIAVATGREHACALLSGGTVKCWGDNVYGEMGDGTTTLAYNTPVSVSGLSGATALAGGEYHNCAIVAGGAVKCWGYNFAGQLGDGTTTLQRTPVSVVGLSGVVGISPGWDHTCALLPSTTIKCWGYNAFGRIGDGTTTTRLAPTSVLGLTGTACPQCAAVRPESASWGNSGPSSIGAGDPVDTATGNFTDGFTDLGGTAALPGLDLVRSYNSANPAVGSMGRGWTEPYGSTATDLTSFVDVSLTDGRVVRFPLSAGGTTYDRPTELEAALSRDPDTSFRVTFNGGEIWEFDLAGRLEKVTAPSGASATIVRAGSGLVSTVTSSAGTAPNQPKLTFTYTAGLLTSVSATDGRSVSYGYTSGRLTSFTDAASKVWTYGYTNDLLSSVTDPTSVVEVSNTYDALGRVISQTSPDGGTETFAYDDATRTTTHTVVATGEVLKYVHDANGRVVQTIDPNNKTTATQVGPLGFWGQLTLSGVMRR